ncbi:hypothetical protein [Microbacterium sp. Se5.02b]|uniref:hypothetical protein n=1 Tax=Microbacterium sp. Se5.02b TaxID=2864103 RepID=UPI002867E35E|nr:hypothetical protein [Microbacterium sp. Se5.02b]
MRGSRLASTSAVTWGRLYFAGQALAGVAWWIAVFTVPDVRTATLGTLDPRLLAVADIPLFVVASALVALGVRRAAWIAAPGRCWSPSGWVCTRRSRRPRAGAHC